MLLYNSCHLLYKYCFYFCFNFSDKNHKNKMHKKITKYKVKIHKKKLYLIAIIDFYRK